MMLNIKKQLGQRIKKLRKEQNYTQEKFAEAIGIAPRTLCYIESGKNFLTADTIEKILKILNITIEELFSVSPNIPSDDLKFELCKMINKVNQREKLEIVYKVVKSILN